MPGSSVQTPIFLGKIILCLIWFISNPEVWFPGWPLGDAWILIQVLKVMLRPFSFNGQSWLFLTSFRKTFQTTVPFKILCRIQMQTKEVSKREKLITRLLVSVSAWNLFTHPFNLLSTCYTPETAPDVENSAMNTHSCMSHGYSTCFLSLSYCLAIRILWIHSQTSYR